MNSACSATDGELAVPATISGTRRRLLLENIEAGAGKPAGHQRVIQRLLLDDPAARGIDQIGGRLDPLQARCVEHPDRFRRLRAMNADEIGARQRCIEIGNRFAARRLDLGGRLVGIIDQNIHFHGKTALGGAGADAAETDDQHRLAEEIVGQHAQTVRPFAVLDDGMHFHGALG